MTFPINKILPEISKFGITLTKEQCNQLNIYGEMLLEWNEKINLTAITDPEDVVVKHFLDCLLFLKKIHPAASAKIIDVGTGAGFPGVVLAIARPDIKITLLDGLNKRLVFLEEVIKNLGLNAKTMHLRAEEGGKKPELREQFDIATARAVARLNVLCEYCLPFVKPGGLFVAMKGPAAEQEINECRNAFQLLGAEQGKIICENLTHDEKRCFVIAKKISQTPSKYPRISAKISKQPL